MNRDMVVCVKRDIASPVIGLVTRHCVDCEAEIVVAPSSIKFIEANKAVVLLCVDCALIEIQTSTGRVQLGVIPGQVREAELHRRRN